MIAADCSCFMRSAVDCVDCSGVAVAAVVVLVVVVAGVPLAEELGTKRYLPFDQLHQFVHISETALHCMH